MFLEVFLAPSPPHTPSLSASTSRHVYQQEQGRSWREDVLQPTLPLKGKQAEVNSTFFLHSFWQCSDLRSRCYYLPQVHPLPYNTVITPSQIRDLILTAPQLTNSVTEPETKVASICVPSFCIFNGISQDLAITFRRCLHPSPASSPSSRARGSSS
jgi:hypothetical protein